MEYIYIYSVYALHKGGNSKTSTWKTHPQSERGSRLVVFTAMCCKDSGQDCSGNAANNTPLIVLDYTSVLDPLDGKHVMLHSTT
jgi:hypothetical protein